MKRQTFRPYDPNQLFLLPPDLRQWLPEDHLVYFVSDVVDSLDLKAVVSAYDNTLGGQPAYDPRLMVKLLVYAYCVGLASSRKIEEATYERVAFRLVAADQHPDHDTIAAFRQRHLQALAALFVQVLRVCHKAGLVKLGHVSLDGTKLRANASKHKAMSYGRMDEREAALQAEVERLLAQAQAVDEEEDQRFGRGRRGDELPPDLRKAKDRLRKIQEARKALEEEARAEAERVREEQRAAQATRQEEGKHRGPEPKPPCDYPDPKAQRNFTDPDSRIMKDGATKSFEQCYNAQAAVDSHAQIIVAAELTQEANDKQQVKPLVAAMKKNLKGFKNKTPRRLTADSGYFSESNITALENQGIDPYIATERFKHGERPPAPRGRPPKGLSVKQRMARKLRTLRGRATYSRRKAVVEPVFGQIKSARGFRQFLLRGLEKVRAEWRLICLTHNLLKVFRSGWRPVTT